MTLLQKLEQEQGNLGVSDRAFAKLLGVSNSMWSETRRGTYPIRFEVLRGAARRFPQLSADIVAYLAQEPSEAVAS